MSSMNHSGAAPASSKDATLNGVKKPVATYNLDDFALPNFALRTLDLTVPPDVRTWRELADYVRANLRILPPFMLERILKLQADYSNAGPAERTSIPAMTPTIKHAAVRGGKVRGGTTHRGAATATPTKTNINVPGAAQSQGLAQIAIGPRESPSDIWRKEAIPANVSVTSGVASGVVTGVASGVASGVSSGVASCVASGVASGFASGVASGVVPGATREQQLQPPRKEAITAGVSAVPGLSREHPTQVLRKEATPAKMIAPPGYPRALPQVSRKEAIPTWSSAPGAHREQPSQAWRKEATPANWSAAPGAHREHPSQVSRKEAIPANWSAAPPGAHREHPSLTSRKETVPVNFNAAPGAHRERPSLTSRKETVTVNFNAAPGAHREHPSLTSRKETVPVNFNAAPGAHRGHPSQASRTEPIQSNWSAAPGTHRENSPHVSRKGAMPVDWGAARGAHREKPSQASRQEAVPMNWSASSGAPRQPPSETPLKEAIPAKVGVGPAILMHGASKQKVVSTATGAAFEQAKPAMANSAKEASQGMQKPATRDTAKGDQSLKSVSVNLNTNEKAKSSKSASKGQVIGKIEAETEEMVLTPMGELIDLSIPINARTPPQPFHPITQGFRHLNGYTTTGENNPMMPALAAIPALIPAKHSDPQPLGLAQGPQPATRVPFKFILPPAATPMLSRHSSSTRSQSPSLYSRTPSPEKSKAADPVLPKQAGRYYLVHKDGGVDYVWVAGAQRGDPCPPHLAPVE